MKGYDKLLDIWAERRAAIRQEYATGKYSIRQLAKKWEVTDTRIWLILRQDVKKSTK